MTRAEVLPEIRYGRLNPPERTLLGPDLSNPSPRARQGLIAVLEGDDAIRDHHREAVDLASEALRDVRSGQAPEAAARTFDDAQSLLAELLP